MSNRRQRPSPSIDLHAMLLGSLRYQRETVIWKLDGLTEEQGRQRHEPSTLTLMGLLKHLADVERTWFHQRFAGREGASPWDDADPDRYWRLEPDDTIAGLIAAYREACTESDRIIEAHGLEDIAADHAPGDMPVTLGWIMTHMIQETARHVGHADLIREAIDGRTGT
ncbi:MAG TPA: DinB family protein [Thermomicrobiales bacterium]|nr:DinB family protein [Thermomicrobiales bacterium]